MMNNPARELRSRTQERAHPTATRAAKARAATIYCSDCRSWSPDRIRAARRANGIPS